MGAAGAHGCQKAITFTVGHPAWIDVVAFGRSNPAFSESTTVIGSLATSSLSSMACAAWRATSGARRASPNVLASANNSSLISF